MRRIYQSRLALSTLRRPCSTSSAAPPPQEQLRPPPPPRLPLREPTPVENHFESWITKLEVPKRRHPLILPRKRAPRESQFESWINNLKPGFTPSDVDEALKAQSDPDLALDIFRWTSQRPNYRHNNQTYLTIFEITISAKRFAVTRVLVDEILAGACTPDIELYNAMIRFCCSRNGANRHAFNAYKKMLNSKDCKPNLETYDLLLSELLRKFRKFPLNYVYLNSVQSLVIQMKACGVVPDLVVLNMVIAAYAKCMLPDEATRLLREIRMYGLEPDAYSYSWVIRALCETERVYPAWDLFKEMRKKSLIPDERAYVILVCSLAMDRRFDDAIEIMFDMMDNSVSPDFLTYQTLLEEMCRDGRGKEVHDLVKQFKDRDLSMTNRTYAGLVDIERCASQ